MSEESISLEEKVSKTISKRIGRQLQLSEIDLAKMEYGLAVLLVISSKIFFIYCLAGCLHIILPVLTTHLAFTLMRRTTKSFHARDSNVCTVLSLFFFVLLPYLVTTFAVDVTRASFVICSLMICLILWFKGIVIAQKPAKSSLLNGKSQMIVVSLFLTIFGGIQSNNRIRTLLLLGMMISTLLMFVQKRKDEENVKKISSRKLKYMRILATVAIAVATEAIGKGTMCTGIIYEPKVPDALKQIEK